MNFVEIHFHLLPGVDDGPSTIEESLELAAAAISDGTSTVVTTPHVHSELFTDPREIAELTTRLSERLQREHLSLKVLPGGELDHRVLERLTQDQLESIAQGPPGSRWILMEAPFSGLREDYTQAADELRARGFAVVVAHPERADLTTETDAVLTHEIDRGSVLQLNAASVAGHSSRHEREFALRLLRDTRRIVIASDAHGRKRPPALSAALAALAAAGWSDPTRFTDAIPRTLLARGVDLLPAARVA